MLRELLRRLQSAILRRPAAVLAGCLVAAVVAGVLGARVELRSSRSELAPANDPDQQRWEAILEEYKASETVIACIEAATPGGSTDAELERFADELAVAFTRSPAVDRVFHRFDVDWLMEHGFYLLPGDRLESALGASAGSDLLAELLAASNLSELNRRLAASLEASFERTAAPPIDSFDAAEGLSLLVAFLEAQRAFLDDPLPMSERWTAHDPLSRLAAGQSDRFSNGYVKTRDGQTVFVVVTPESTDDSLPERRRFIGSLRQEAERVSERLPGFHVAFTGTAAMTVEEMDTVRRDTWRTSSVAILGVVLLTFFVFRWRTHALLVLFSLAIGLVWSIGAVWLELGYLNLVTSAFISTLVGVGVAYGIHPVSEYELEGAHTQDPTRAVAESFRRTGAAVVSAGITTSVAFFSILLMRFRGFAELGLVAGVGVLLCLLSSLVCLPAVLVLYGRWRHGRDRARREVSVTDRLWIEALAARVCCFPRITVSIAAVATIAAAYHASGISFNTNILDLLPANSESLRYQRKMVLQSDLSPVFNIAIAEDLDGLAQMRARAAEEVEIGRFESVLTFLPVEPERTRRLLAAWRERLADQAPSPSVTPLERASLEASLRALEEVLAFAADQAFAAGMGDLAGPLEEARSLAEDCAVAASAPDAELLRDWNEGQRRLHRWILGGWASLQRALEAAPPSIDNLPTEIVQRFFTDGGRPVAFLYPSGNVFDPDELDRYVSASLRVSPAAIGFPFMFDKMSRRITHGFYRAVVAGGLFVMLVLLIDLRSFRSAFLAVTPLAIGLVWTMATMRVAGLSFNFANLVGVPLIIGVGIDNGVHVLHRVKLEGREGMGVVLRHTGRAILIASLTTMIGFGSLALASHRGLASLGLLLLIGVGSCLVASTIVLPNILVLLRVADR